MKRFVLVIGGSSVLLAILLTSCMSLSPPSKPKDLCEIFAEKRFWYRQAVNAENKWDIPVATLMAVIRRESSFIHNAKPPRTKILWVIPWKRLSSAYGYAQAKDSTWADYKERTGNGGARRTNFRDAVDFVGWYLDNAARSAGIARSDTRNLYLTYHEGISGYRSGKWRSKPHVMVVATQVEEIAQSYHKQLMSCQKRPGRNYR